MYLSEQLKMACDSGQAGAEIEVTSAMIAAGREELLGHPIGGDLDYMLESVFRSMSYAALDSASATSPSK